MSVNCSQERLWLTKSLMEQMEGGQRRDKKEWLCQTFPIRRPNQRKIAERLWWNARVRPCVFPQQPDEARNKKNGVFETMLSWMRRKLACLNMLRSVVAALIRREKKKKERKAECRTEMWEGDRRDATSLHADSLIFNLSLALSLSHTHTHTHTHSI